jgi:hypothetical protein
MLVLGRAWAFVRKKNDFAKSLLLAFAKLGPEEWVVLEKLVKSLKENYKPVTTVRTFVSILRLEVTSIFTCYQNISQECFS